METTSTESGERKHVNQGPPYFHRETMFILADTAAATYNSPPRLLSPKEVNIMEDSGSQKHHQLITFNQY